MPGPRRTLAAAVCAAVVGLFLVAGVGVAQAVPHQRATGTHVASAAAHQAAHVKASGQHADQHHLDLWALPPVDAPATPRTAAAVVETSAVVVVPSASPAAAGRGPPAA